jgi:hypothetical protein
MGKRGATPKIIYTRVIRIQIPESRRALLSFFQNLDQLPRGKRNGALLDAVEHGAQASMEKASAKSNSKESAKMSRALDSFLDDF